MPLATHSSAEAIRSAVCSTFTFDPCLSMPPRICITQPGQSITTSSEPEFLMFVSLRSSMGAEISGSFSD